jgi:two-component system, chemotaxis family, protein-glutamate methylesterase/glutaminase
MSAAPVRVAICDDSRAYAVGLCRFLETDRGLQVVATAGSAEELLGDLARVRPDLITMDLELPGIDGVQAIRRIMATMPVPIVVISTHAAADDDDGLISAALAAGARDALAKSEVRLDRRMSPQAVALRRRLARLVTDEAEPSAPEIVISPTPPAGRGEGPGPVEARVPQPGIATVVGLAASAGGPGALGEVLGALPADFGLPVLVVQHISEGFAAGLAAWLDGVISPAVRLARHGEPAGRGVVIAPDNAHLLLGADGRLRLDREIVCGAHRPSADVLLTSLATVAGRGVVAAVLTGMGGDGAAGVSAVLHAGGVALTEHPEQANLRGMPTAAAEAGATPLSRAEIGQALTALSARTP